MDMISSELHINATEFKAKCLDIFRRLQDGSLRKVFITRRGRLVAELTPPPSGKDDFKQFLETMRGSVKIPPGVDIVGPIFDGEINADRGILYIGE